MMPEISFSGLMLVAAVAFAVPLLLSLAPRLRLPSVVLEIVAGIVIGPSGLGWVEVDQATGATRVAAGLLSVMIFPLMALTILRRGEPAPVVIEPGMITSDAS